MSQLADWIHDDITWCMSECDNKECFRHFSNRRAINGYFSGALFKGTQDCPYYDETKEEQKEETKEEPEKDAVLKKYLKYGNFTYDSGNRIIDTYWELDYNNFVKWLKNEFGFGGLSIDEGFYMYTSDGIEISLYEEKIVLEYSWDEIAQIYKEMIETGKFQ